MWTQESFYHSKQWESFREIVIAQRTESDGYVRCALCGKPIVNKYDLIVDHIEELNDNNVNDVNVSLNPDNVRCVHARCHNIRHERFGRNNYMNRRKMVYIVYGAPCSGKSTFVSDHASDIDLIVDMNNIYQMISNNARYIKPNRLNGAAFSIRNVLYDLIKYRNGKWQDAYIITGGARSGDRERLKQRVNANELIFIDCPKDICLMRASERGKDWIDYINNWFDEYEA